MSMWSLTYEQSVAYLSAITVTNVSESFYLQDGGKNQLADTWNKITSLSYVYTHHSRGKYRPAIYCFLGSFNTVPSSERALDGQRERAQSAHDKLGDSTITEQHCHVCRLRCYSFADSFVAAYSRNPVDSHAGRRQRQTAVWLGH